MLHVSRIVVAASILFQIQSGTEPRLDGVARRVVLMNNTRAPIAEIYVSDDGAGDWQEDLLGSEFLLPGNSAALYVEDQNGNCRVDVRVVFDSGSILVNRGFNACPAEGHAVPVR